MSAMTLPAVTSLLRFSGPAELCVRDHRYPLPRPNYCEDALDDPSFPKQVNQDLYGKSFVLSDAIEQRKSCYPSFRRSLQQVLDKVRNDVKYGPDALLCDIMRMGENCPSDRMSNDRRVRWKRQLKMLQHSLSAEIGEFQSCPDCVAHYYCFDQPFLIPCRKPHALVLVCDPRDKMLMPGKALAIETDMVLVALFDKNRTRIFVDRSRCFLLSMHTFQYIWSRDWTKAPGATGAAFADFFKHLLMLTARFGSWFIGAATSTQSVSTTTLIVPDSFFKPLSQSQHLIDLLFVPERTKRTCSVKRQRRPENRVRCLRRGCRNRVRKKDPVPCLLCDLTYCSLCCREKDISDHCQSCEMPHAVDMEHDVHVAAETADLIAEVRTEFIRDVSLAATRR